jgi:hypothetical protein
MPCALSFCWGLISTSFPVPTLTYLPLSSIAARHNLSPRALTVLHPSPLPTLSYSATLARTPSFSRSPTLLHPPAFFLTRPLNPCFCHSPLDMPCRQPLSMRTLPPAPSLCSLGLAPLHSQLEYLQCSPKCCCLPQRRSLVVHHGEGSRGSFGKHCTARSHGMHSSSSSSSGSSHEDACP